MAFQTIALSLVTCSFLLLNTVTTWFACLFFFGVFFYEALNDDVTKGEGLSYFRE